MNLTEQLAELTFKNLFAMAKEANGGPLGYNPHTRFTGAGMKGRFAEHIAATIPAAKLEPLLPKYQAASAEAYKAVQIKTGKPVPRTTFTNPETPTMPQAATPTPPTDAELQAIMAAATGQGAITNQGAQAQAPGSNVPQGDTSAAAELAAVMARIIAGSQAQVNPEQVAAIARVEIAAALAKIGALPTRVEIATPSGQTVNMGLQHKTFPDLIKALQVQDDAGYILPVWLPGPAGSGKTTAAKNAAKALSEIRGRDIKFYHTGAVSNEYKLMGFRDAGGNYAPTEFRKAYEHGGLFLWDEVDASDAGALVAFNAAMENGECAFPDATIPRHPDCILIAAANTYGAGATHEYVGRTKIDAATVDRFTMLSWDYDEALEVALANNAQWVALVQRYRKGCHAAGIKHVISPRASIRGAKYLAAGFTQEQVLNMVVWKGLSPAQIATIRQAA